MAGRRYACGDRIGDKYQLIRPIDHGGMGVLWAAHHLRLDTHVALKFILAESDSPAAAVRLLDEARAGARLRHPAIVRIFDFDETPEGRPFIVMELLDGEPLNKVLERRRPDAVTVVRTLLPVADALVALHEKGIVHRDVKPENIILARDDAGRIQPKLVDFGIARLDRARAGHVTGQGVIVGSPQYIAPEQILQEEIDARTDVWAFSVVLYETLTGTRPFNSEPADSLFRSILWTVPAPITERSAGDVELDAIVARGLAKTRDARWRSMRELGTALARWLERQSATTDVCGASLQATWCDDRQAAPCTEADPDISSVDVEPRTPIPRPVTPAPSTPEPPTRPRTSAASGSTTTLRSRGVAPGLEPPRARIPVLIRPRRRRAARLIPAGVAATLLLFAALSRWNASAHPEADRAGEAPPRLPEGDAHVLPETGPGLEFTLNDSIPTAVLTAPPPPERPSDAASAAAESRAAEATRRRPASPRRAAGAERRRSPDTRARIDDLKVPWRSPERAPSVASAQATAAREAVRETQNVR